MFPQLEDIFLAHFIDLSENLHDIMVSIRTNWIQSHDVLINVGERQNFNRTARRLQGIDANIRRPSTPLYSSPRRAVQCINSLPVSTVRIKKELIKPASPACNVVGSGENMESTNNFLLEYGFYPDRKYDHQLCTLIPSQPVSIENNNHKLECDICLSDYKSGQKVRHLPCGHMFHRECIDKWLANAETCPRCRKHVANTLRGLLVRKKAHNARTRFQSSVSENSNSLNTARRQNIPSSVIVKHNRTSTMRLELARNRRATNIEFESATGSDSSPNLQVRITSDIQRPSPICIEENPSASASVASSVELNAETSVGNGVLHSTNDKDNEKPNGDSIGEPRQKAAEAAIRRYEQFQRKIN